MPAKKKRALGRGMAELVEGSFASIVDPAKRAVPRDDGPPPASAAPRPEAVPDAAPQVAAREPAAAQPHRGVESREPVSIREVRMEVDRRADGKPLEGAGASDQRAFNVVSISSGKGGTGKTVLTTNLGILLSGPSRVTILDADLGLANVHILCDLTPRFNVGDVIRGRKSLEEITLKGPRGVGIVPGGSGVPELASLTDLMFGSLVEGLGGLDRSTDLLLIDTPSGIDRQSLLFLLASDEVLVVTTEDVTAMTDAYAVIKTLLTRRPAAAVAVVVNQARSYAEGLETFQRIAHVARKFLGRELALGGIIPVDPMVERSIAERVPVVIGRPACPAARAMASVAARVRAFHSRVPHAGTPFSARLSGLLEGHDPGRAQGA